MVKGMGDDVLVHVVGEVVVEALSDVLWTAFSSMNTSGRPLTKQTRSARRL